MRLEQTVAPARLREAIKTGIAETNAELFLWREQQIAGVLASLPTCRLTISTESVRVFYYLRAVTSMATATLYERYRGVDASAKGDKKADSIDTTVDELWRDMRWAVSRVQDKPRCIVSHPMQAIAQQGDTLDMICARYYGRTESLRVGARRKSGVSRARRSIAAWHGDRAA